MRRWFAILDYYLEKESIIFVIQNTIMKKIVENNFLIYKQYFRAQPFYCMIRLLFSVLSIVQPLSSIYLFQLFLDSIFNERSIRRALVLVLICAFCNFTVAVFSWFINSRMTPISEQRNTIKYTKELMDIYLRKEVSEIETSEFYNKYSQILNDIVSRVMLVQDAICGLIGQLFSVGIIISLMLRVGSVLIFITLFGVLANIFFMPMINKLGYDAYQEKTIYVRKQDYLKRVFYIKDYIKDLKIYDIAKKFSKENVQNGEKIISIIDKFSKKTVFWGIIASLLQCVSFGGVLAYLAYSALYKNWSIGYVAAMYNATEELKNSIATIFEIIPSFDDNSRYIENYLSLKNQGEEKKKEKNVSLEEIKKIQFKDVSFSYDKENKKFALEGINCCINRNEIVALVGDNGAGKSTLINLLLHFYNPTNGNIEYNGISCLDFDMDQLKKQVLVVFQDSPIYAMSIAENILMHKYMEEDREKVFEALKKADLLATVEKLPEGIHTTLTKEFDDNGVVFSGGQMQKLLIARVFASEAKIVILDEITSALDAITEYNIFSELKEFAKGKTMIFVSHKLFSTKMANKIYVFEAGKIVERGSHKELIEKQGKYYNMFSTQAREYDMSEEY